MSVTISKGRTFVDSEKITPTKLNDAFDEATVDGLGTMATQDSSAVSISGGNANLSILTVDRLTPNQETGYPTSGAIPLNPDDNCNAYIALAGNATFSVVGMAAGRQLDLLLKNATGGSITLTWPAWSVPAGVTMPTSLAAGAYLKVRLDCFGTNIADVVPTYN